VSQVDEWARLGVIPGGPSGRRARSLWGRNADSETLDTADLQERSEALAIKTAYLKENLVKLAIEIERLKGLKKQMLASPHQQISLTDPDSRSMATAAAVRALLVTTCRWLWIRSII
jgi:hypothetical protein